MDFDVANFIAKVEEFANKDAKRQNKTDGKLDKYEKTSLFNSPELTQELTTAIQNGEVNEIDAKEIFGLSKKDYSKYKQTASKTSANMMQDDVLDRVFKGGSSYFYTNDSDGKVVLDSDISWDTLVDDLKNRLIGENVQSVNKEYYTKLLDEVSSVTDKVKQALKNAKANRGDGQSYDSRDDVLKLYDQLKKELKADKKDEFADFKSSVLQNLMFIVEKHQIAKEQTRVTDAYNDFRKKGLSREKAVEAVRTAKDGNGKPKFKGSYYDSFSNHFGTVGKSVSHKGLLSDMERGIVLEDARQEVMDAVWAQRGKDIYKSGDVEDAAKEALGDHNDKYTAKIFRGELSFTEKLKWERSVIKDFRKAVAAYNRVEANKKREFTENDITSVVKDDKIFVQMVSDGQLIRKNENGTYNITGLADLVRDAVSYVDYRANYQTKDNSTLGEIESVIKAVKVKTNIDITRADAKRLIDFCGFDRDKKNALLVIYNGLLGSWLPGASSLVTALLVNTTPGDVTLDPTNLNSKLKDMEFPINITSQNDIKFNLDVSVKTIVDGVPTQGKTTINTFEIMRKLAQQGFGPGEAGFEILEDGTFRLWIDKASEASTTQMAQLRTILGENFEIDVNEIDVNREPDKVHRSKAFFAGLATGAALAILSEALKELPGEKPVLTTDFLSTNPEEYEKELSKENNLPARARAGVTQLAKYFYEKDGNLDGYHDFLRRAAGGSSVLNKKELLFAIYMKLAEIKNEIVEPKTAHAQEEVKQIEYETDMKKIDEVTYTPRTVKFTAWQDLVNGYDCLNDKRYNVPVKSHSGRNVMLNNRMVKVMQAIDLSKVSNQETIESVYDLEKLAAFTRKAIEMGIDTAMQEFPNFPIDKDKYNDVVFAKGGVKGSVVIPDVYDNGTKCEWVDNGRVDITLGGKDVVTVTTTTRTINGEEHYYKRVKGSNDAWQEIPKTDYDSLQKK